ncbi:hypothetical protein DRO22_02620 [Candidatus Bathyarchaeota archaeon]|nr:MAG: hypothetical protein DRO22_02620 [Candidatus Bathyarchaeota archaeon]
MKKTVVRLIFWGVPKGTPMWPTISFDTEKRAKEILKILEENLPDFKFVGGTLIKNLDEAKALLEEIGKEGEVCSIIFHLSSGWYNAYNIMKKLPTVVICDPFLWGYAGMITHSVNLRKKDIRGFIVSSSSWDEIFRAFKVIKAYNALREAKILVIGDHVLSAGRKTYSEALKNIGAEIKFLDFKELREEFENVDAEEVESLVDEFISKANKIIEPSREEIIKSIRLYRAIKNLCLKYDASGVTIDCLGGFYGRSLPAYPCIAFSLLDGEGGVMAACECDVDSLLTKIAMKEIADRPGFISEPAVDTSRNVAIYAHCVSSIHMSGFSNPPEEYWIRSHAEDDKGACVQVLFKGGIPATVMKIIPLERRILLLKGELLGHEETEGGCRNKAVVKVADAQRLIDEWQHNWHRVLFYGDWVKEITWLAKLMGFKVFMEPGGQDT